MDAPRLPRTAAVIGGGAVGSVLLPALRSASVRLVATWNRTPKAPLWRSGVLPRAIREAEIVLLAVSDGAVREVCQELADAGVIGKGQLVAHLAGSLDLSPLEPALHAGALVGSLHPLRAVPPGSRADALVGAACGIDGSDEEARGRLELLAQSLQMKPLASRGLRALYHAAAVLAGGGQVALFSEAVRAFRGATGQSEEAAREALLPLARGALDQLAAKTPAQAITGPVVRGDAAIVSAHLSALEPLGYELSALYWLLSLVSSRLAKEGSRTPPEALEDIALALHQAGRAMLPFPERKSGGPPAESADSDAATHAAHAPHAHAHQAPHAHAHQAPRAPARAKKPKKPEVARPATKAKPPARPGKGARPAKAAKKK